MPVAHFGDQEFHLSVTELEALSEFQAIAQFNDEEAADVIGLLSEHGWNLEGALSRFFDGEWRQGSNDSPHISSSEVPERRVEMPIPSEFRDAPNPPLPSFASYLASDYVPKLPLLMPLSSNLRGKYAPGPRPLWIMILMVIPQALSKLASGLFTVLYALVTFGFRNHLDPDKRHVSRIPDFPSESKLDLDQILSYIPDTKRQRFKELISSGAYMDLYDEAQSEYKHLLIILLGKTAGDQEDRDINSQLLLTKVLTDDLTLDLLEQNKETMLIYLKQADELEPWALAHELGLKYTPECLIAANVMNGNGNTTKMSILSKLRLNSPKKFRNSLRDTLTKYSAELTVSRTEKEELRIARQIKQLQEEAFQESLRQDQMKDEKKKLAALEAEAQKQLELEKELNQKRRATLKHLQWLKLCVEKIQRKKNTEVELMKSKTLATLQVRTAKGLRFIKRFTPDTTLHSMYLSIGCHLYLDTDDDNEHSWMQGVNRKLQELTNSENLMLSQNVDAKVNDIEQIRSMIMSELESFKDLQDYSIDEIEFDFELVSPFPRFKVPLDKKVQITEIPEIWPKGSLLVEDLVCEEEEEEEEDDDDDDHDNKEAKEEKEDDEYDEKV